MSKSLGTLTIDMIAKIGGYVEGMSKMDRETQKRMRSIKKELSTVGDRIKKVTLAAAGAVTTGIAIMTHFVNGARESIDAQAKLAQSLDTTVTGLANVTRAGELSGVAFAGIEQATKDLQRRLSQAADGTGPATKALGRLNLVAEDLMKLPLDQRIALINSRIREFVPAAQQAAISGQLFGEEGSIAMSRISPETIAQAAHEVKVFGLNLSDVDAQKVEQANDAFSRFSMMRQGLIQGITVQLSPILQMAGDRILEMAENTGGLHEATAELFDRMVIGGINIASTFRSVMKPVKEIITDIWNGYQSLPPWAQEVGVLGAIIGGRKGVAALALVSKAAEDTKVTAAWFAAMTSGDVGFAEWLSAGPTEARERLKELGFDIDNLKLHAEGPSIIQSLFTVDDAEADAWADNMIAAYRAAVDRAQEMAEETVSNGGTPQQQRFIVPQQSEELAKLFETTEENMRRQIALFGVTGEAAKVYYETQRGNLADLDLWQQNRLLTLGYELDFLKKREEEEQKAEEGRKARIAQIEEFGKQAARNMQTYLADFFFDPLDAGIKGTLKKGLDMLRRLASEALASAALKALFGGFAGSSNTFVAALGSTFAGAKDAGGSVPSNRWAIAGEYGPEIVRGPASVTSRADTAKMLGGVNITVINNAPATVRQETRFDGGRRSIEFVIDAVKQGWREGALDDVTGGSRVKGAT